MWSARPNRLRRSATPHDARSPVVPRSRSRDAETRHREAIVKKRRQVVRRSSSGPFQRLLSGVTDQHRSIRRQDVRSWDTRGLRQARRGDSIPIDRAGPSV